MSRSGSDCLEEIVERARKTIAPEAREAAGLIAYLHRSRDAVERMQHELTAETRRLEEERRALREEWVARQKSRIAELERRFAETLANHERRDGARAIEAVHDRELRAKIEKGARKSLASARSEARSDADSAVLAQLSESQGRFGRWHTSGAAAGDGAVGDGARVRLKGISGAGGAAARGWFQRRS